jgi:hypothetical protein
LRLPGISRTVAPASSEWLRATGPSMSETAISGRPWLCSIKVESRTKSRGLTLHRATGPILRRKIARSKCYFCPPATSSVKIAGVAASNSAQISPHDAQATAALERGASGNWRLSTKTH